jgi:hypothetical protein
MARAKRPGGYSGGPPEGISWMWMTTDMLGSLTLGALGVSARRILDFLMVEYSGGAGRENGHLVATYRQLEHFGLTRADIAKGFAELIATGFVRLTKQGLRQAGGGEPSRYALTWLPTGKGTPSAQCATNDWGTVGDRLHREGIMTVRAIRRWLKDELALPSRGTKKRVSSGDI